jgi:hypothetical protein
MHPGFIQLPIKQMMQASRALKNDTTIFRATTIAA